jgi:hypothetical protein
VAIDVEQVADHRQPEFLVTAGVGREWLDDSARAALGERGRALGELARRLV